jgi:hypothetical protein
VNAKDWNGHVPDEPEANDEQTGSTPLCPYEDPARRYAWIEGYLAAVGIVAAHGQAQLDAVLERRAA